MVDIYKKNVSTFFNNISNHSDRVSITSSLHRAKVILVCISLTILAISPANSYAIGCCGSKGLCLEILGSGGPEADDGRASSAYLIWIDGKARVMVDMGAGAMFQFEKSGARIEDLDAILFTHFHVDHSADLPALIKASFFTGRDHDLPLYGPSGNTLMPSAKGFVNALFAQPDGAFHYLSGYLDGNEAYKLQPHTVEIGSHDIQTVLNKNNYTLSAIAVHHGPIPALAWRVDIGGHSIVFSGDMNGDYGTLPLLAKNTDMLVANHAIPEGATGVARNLHMPPSVIGKIAATAKVGKVILSHRMKRTYGHEAETINTISTYYGGPVKFAEDAMCVPLQNKNEKPRSVIQED